MSQKFSNNPDFHDWKAYPTNLDVDDRDIDTARLKERLDADANRLFVSDSDSELLFVGLDPLDAGAHLVKQDFYTSAERFDLELSRISSRKDLRIFYIPQSFSWSRLSISEDHFLKLFTFLRVYPGFLDIVHTSGEKIAPVEESFIAQFARLLPQSVFQSDVQYDAGYELGYSIKYVEKHGRKHTIDPYSLRETGIYQKWDSRLAKAQWILMHPSESLRTQLESVFPATNHEDLPYLFCVNATILLNASHNWRPYVNYLENNFSKLVDRGFFTNIQGPSHEGDIDADFSDVRKLQIMTDKLRRLHQVLELNIEVGIALQDFAERIRQAWRDPVGSEFNQFKSNISAFLFQQRTQQSRIKSMLDRADGISTLVRTIVTFRDAESSRRIIESIRDLTLQTVQENKNLERLSKSSAKDTRSMMLITLITTIFLPATFVATFFGSNFFGFSASGDGQESNLLNVASNIWIYVVVTVVLLILTLGGGFICWRMSRRVQHVESPKSPNNCPTDSENEDLERQLGTG